eukprot:538700_1
MCSKCIDGSYLLTGSHTCDENCINTNYWYIVVLFILALVFAVFVIFILSKKKSTLSRHEINWRKILLRDETNLANVLIFKIYLYFYQALSQVLATKGIELSSNFTNILLSIFNFEIIVSSSTGFCLFGKTE